MVPEIDLPSQLCVHHRSGSPFATGFWFVWFLLMDLSRKLDDEKSQNERMSTFRNRNIIC